MRRRSSFISRLRPARVLARRSQPTAKLALFGLAPEDAYKVIQTISIVVGAVWVLIDYRDFKKENNRLVNIQLSLANRAAELNQSSIALNEKLNEFKMARASEGRIETSMTSYAVRVVSHQDGSSTYRYGFEISVKNVSDAPILIPAATSEFFIGSNGATNLQSGDVVLLNAPISFMNDTSSGKINWAKKGGVVVRMDSIDAEVESHLGSFDRIAGPLAGELRAGEKVRWQQDYLLRANHNELAGAVVTIWAGARDEALAWSTYTSTELLSEAKNSEVPGGTKKLGKS